MIKLIFTLLMLLPTVAFGAVSTNIISAQAPLQLTLGVMSIPQATGSVNGFLSAADWTSFNSKLSGSILTTKGDLLGYSSSIGRIPIGTNGYVLTADSTQTFGVKWAATSSPFSPGDLTTSTSGVTIGNGTSAVNGSGTTVDIASADATHNGLWTTGTQTLAGDKQLNGSITFAANTIYQFSTNSTLTGSNQTISSHPNVGVRLTNSGLISVSDITAPLAGGHTLYISNDTGNEITLVNNHDASGNQIITGWGADAIVPPNGIAELSYYLTGGYWKLVTSAAPNASTSQRGMLTSTDWNTFNSKEPAITVLPISKGGTNNGSLSVTNGTVYYGDGTKLLGLAPSTDGKVLTLASGIPSWATPAATGITTLNTLTTATQTFATGTSGSDFNISSVTSTHTFNLPTASASNRGALSSTDWSTFNSKQDTVSFGTFGSTPNSAGGSISSGVITLQPADSTHPGGLSTTTQTIPGAKTLSSVLTLTPNNRQLILTGGTQSASPENTYLDISGTLLANVAGAYAAYLHPTTSGSTANSFQIGLYSNMAAGMTGTQTGNVGLYGISNLAATDGANVSNIYGNFGVYGEAGGASSTGGRFGVVGAGYGAQTNVGVWGHTAAGQSSTSPVVGVIGTSNATGKKFGGIFSLRSVSDASIFPSTSAALVVDNGAQAVDILALWDNGSKVASFADGGTLNLTTLSASQPVVSDASKNLISGSVTSPITFSASSIGCQTASGSQAGCLSSSDWTTFNGKLGTSLTSAHIFVGNGSNVATDIAVTGDVTITNAGVTAIGTNKVANSQLAQMATNTLKGNNTGGTANAADLTVSQVNTMLGDVTTMGAFGSTPNSNGASISGNTLTLQPANGSNPGGLSTSAQTMGAGAKTFTSSPIVSTAAAAGDTQYVNTATGTTSGDGLLVGIDASGNGVINQQENLPVTFSSNNTGRARIQAAGRVTVGNDLSETTVVDPNIYLTDATVFDSLSNFTGINNLLSIGNMNGFLWTPSADTNTGTFTVTVAAAGGNSLTIAGSKNLNGGLTLGNNNFVLSGIGAFGAINFDTVAGSTTDGIAGTYYSVNHDGLGGTLTEGWGAIFNADTEDAGGLGTPTGSVGTLTGGLFTTSASGVNATTAISVHALEPFAVAITGPLPTITNQTSLWIDGTMSHTLTTVATSGNIASLAVPTSVIRLTGNPTIQGIHSDTFAKEINIICTAGCTIGNQNGSASANDRIITGSGVDLVGVGDAAFKLIYDTTDLRYRVISSVL